MSETKPPTAVAVVPGDVVIPYDKAKTAKKAIAAMVQAGITIALVAVVDAMIAALQDDPTVVGRLFEFAGAPAVLALVAVPLVNGGLKYGIEWWRKRDGVVVPAKQAEQIALEVLSKPMPPTLRDAWVRQ